MDNLEGFKKICKVNALKENQGKRFIVNDVDVAVFKVKDSIYAISNICPHQHAALLYDGFVEEGKVACPAHGWEFELDTGKLVNAHAKIDTYEVKILDDDVYVKVFKKDLKW